MKLNRGFLRAAAVAPLAAAAFGIATAGAADPDKHAPNAKFDALDANKDGVLSLDEVKAQPSYLRAFDAADANHDGKLDRDEFIKAEAIHDRIVAGNYVEDSVLTARVKTALLQEPDLKSLDVSVETQDGVVLLSGFVHDSGQRRRALKAAGGVSGVTSVKDAMIVR